MAVDVAREFSAAVNREVTYTDMRADFQLILSGRS
jgi:hypothetical protein